MLAVRARRVRTRLRVSDLAGAMRWATPAQTVFATDAAWWGDLLALLDPQDLRAALALVSVPGPDPRTLRTLVQLLRAAPVLPWEDVFRAAHRAVRTALADQPGVPAETAEAWGGRVRDSGDPELLGVLLRTRAATAAELEAWTTTLRTTEMRIRPVTLRTPGRETWVVDGPNAGASLTLRPDVPDGLAMGLLTEGHPSIWRVLRERHPDWPVMAARLLDAPTRLRGVHDTRELLGAALAASHLDEGRRLGLLERYAGAAEPEHLEWLRDLSPAGRAMLHARAPQLLQALARPGRLAVLAAMGGPGARGQTGPDRILRG